MPRGISGKRVLRTRLVRTHDLVVAVDVEAVLPEDDTSEPYREAETAQLLGETATHLEPSELGQPT